MTIVINVYFKGAKAFQKSLLQIDSQMNTKCQQALNRTLVRSRTQMTNAVGEKLNLKKKTIRDLVRVQQANKATGLIGKVSVKSEPVPLIEYGASQNRKGVSFKIFRDRPRKMIRQAFIMPNRRGEAMVFKRLPNVGRLPIKALYGTMVANVAEDNLEGVGKFCIEFIKKEIVRLIHIR